MKGCAKYVKLSLVVLGLSVVQDTWVWAKDQIQLDEQAAQPANQPPAKNAAGEQTKQQTGVADQQEVQTNPDAASAAQKESTAVPGESATGQTAGAKENEPADNEKQQKSGATQQPPEADVTAPAAAAQQQEPTVQQEAVDESVSSLPKIDSQLGIPPIEKFALHKVLRLRQDVRQEIQNMAGVDRRLQGLTDNIAAFYETDARLVIFGENSMQRQGYQLRRAEYFLDGRKIADYQYSSKNPAASMGPLFEGAVTPGCHTLKVRLDYLVKHRPFPYKTGYRVYMHGEQSFRMQEGQTAVLRAVGFTQEHLPSNSEKRGDLQQMQFVMQAEPNRVKGRPIVDLTDVLNEAGLEVSVRNNMPPEYELIGFDVHLNGIPLKDALKPDEAAQTGVLFRGPVLPGKDQRLQVQVTYRGREKNYGYLGHHQFALNFERKIDLAANATTPVRLTAFLGEPASFTVERTPSVRMEVSQASVNTNKIELVATCKPVAYFEAKQREKTQNQQQDIGTNSSNTQEASSQEQL